MADDRRTLVVTSLLAALMAAIGALLTVAFIKVLEWCVDQVWTEVPKRLDVDPYTLAYALPVCAVGGLLVGGTRVLLGEHPKGLEEAINDFKVTKRFDYSHLWQGVLISLVSLGFGAALGPEAALVAIIGGVCTWVGDGIKASERGAEGVSYLGVVGSLGALFGSVGAAAVPIDPASAIEQPAGESESGRKDRRERVMLLVPGLVAAFAGAWVFKKLSDTGGYFSFNLPAYSFSASDIGHALLVAVVGLVVGMLLLAAINALRHLTVPLDRIKPVQSLIGGIALGLLAVVSPFALFSGHSGIDDILLSPDNTAKYFFGLVLIKVASTSICTATGWKGGRFFPVMFAGAAAGLALTMLVTGMPETVAVAAGMTATVACLLKKPIPAILLMVFIFGVALLPVVIISGGVAGLIAQRLEPRLPFVFGPMVPWTPGDEAAATV